MTWSEVRERGWSSAAPSLETLNCARRQSAKGSKFRIEMRRVPPLNDRLLSDQSFENSSSLR
jgi:hypothetical protein